MRLTDGTVLLAGGVTSLFGDQRRTVATALRYFPAAHGNTWFAPIANMQRARRAFTGTLLLNGTVLVAGGSGDNTSEIYTPPANPPIATRGATSVDFGAIPVGTSQDRTVSITNTGEDFLVISGFPISPPAVQGTGGFLVNPFNGTSGCPSFILAAGATCTLSVTFVAGAAQSYNATLSFTDNATGSPQTVALSGSGARTDTFSPTSVSFGAQAVGTADTRVVILTNNSSQTLHISTVSITPADAFSIGGNTCGQSLASHASCGITVRFQPPAGQAYTATLSLFDDAATAANTVALSGSGSFAGGPAPSFSPASVDFGNVPIGASVNGYQSVQLTNAGSQPLTISSLSLATSGNGSDFAIVDFRCQGKTIASGDYCVIYLKFHPGATGGRTGTLNVYSNANADQSVPTTLALSGAGFNGSAHTHQPA